MIVLSPSRPADPAYPCKLARTPRGMLVNLISHVCRLATDGSWQRPGDVMHPAADLEAGDEDLAPLVHAPGGYLRAAQALLRLLSPEHAGCVGPAASLAKVRIQLNLLVALWDEVVIGDLNVELAQRAVALAKKILVHSPGETGSFIGECCEVLGAPESLRLLSEASRHTKTHHDALWLEHAQDQVAQVLLAPFGQPAGGHPPAIVSVSPPRTNVTTGAVGDALPLTESHQKARSRLDKLGALFFRDLVNPFPEAGLKPRYFPLLAGPTGVGKTFLVQDTARYLNAEYYKVTRGDWIPQGARVNAGESTTFTLLDLIVRQADTRLVLHIDEFDKLTGIEHGRSDWSASQQTDIWNVFDGDLPFRAYLSARRALKLTEVELREKVRRSLWIVGSGTWQELFEDQRRSSVGFVQPATVGVTSSAVHDCRKISAEILARFNSDVIILNYPDEIETSRLLEATGIMAIAARLGVRISPNGVDWHRGGIRVLESIKTDLTLQYLERFPAACQVRGPNDECG